MRSYYKKISMLVTVLLILGLTSSGVFADNEMQNQNAPPGRSVTDFSGSGTAESPYQIRDATDMVVLSNEVAKGNHFEKTFFQVMNDLDFNGVRWRPIGTLENTFKGHFNGNDKLILNLNYAGNEICAGVFGCIENATVENIIIDRNCTFKNDNRNGKFGAVVGYAQQSTVKSCENNAYVTGLSDSGGDTDGVGGVVGVSYATKIDCCVNNGMVTGYIAVGGIVGNGQAVNCINNGRVSGASTSSYLGGIAGKAMKDAAYNCVNNGPVSGGTKLGGIVGGAYTDSISLTIRECINRGSVTSLKPTGMMDYHLGGILGQSGSNLSQFHEYAGEYSDFIIDCSNYGKIDHPITDNSNSIVSRGVESPLVINSNNDNDKDHKYSKSYAFTKPS